MNIIYQSRSKKRTWKKNSDRQTQTKEQAEPEANKFCKKERKTTTSERAY